MKKNAWERVVGLGLAGILVGGLVGSGWAGDEPAAAGAVGAGLAGRDEGVTAVDVGWFIPAGSPLKNFYWGVGVGPMVTDYSESVDDGSVSNVADGDVGTGAGLFMGYNLGDYFGIEASVGRLEDVDFDAVSDGSGDSWVAGKVGAEYEAEMYSMFLVGRFPLAPRWVLFGKLGFTYWESKETFTENGFTSIDEDSGSSGYIGGGVEVDIGVQDRFKLRAEIGYTRFDEDEVDSVGGSVGVVYEFP